jgi:3-deoxy-D-manno-octulosonate 8-phosphate phosphatase (KDO 8-P phosphatase)
MQLNSRFTREELQSRAAAVQMLLMDVDGVLTSGHLFLVPDGNGSLAETKGFDSQDGIALRWLRWYDIKTGVISGRNSPATVERARQVDMSYVYQGHIEKIPILEEILRDSGIARENIAYIGDDLTDTVLMRRVGISFATANARQEVKQVAMATTNACGGSGAVREVIEFLLQSKGIWEELLKKYEVID